MRQLALLLIFLVILAGALIAYTPLGFVVSQSGVGAAGVGWALDGVVEMVPLIRLMATVILVPTALWAVWTIYQQRISAETTS